MDMVEVVARAMVGNSFDKMGHYERRQWLETARPAVELMTAEIEGLKAELARIRSFEHPLKMNPYGDIAAQLEDRALAAGNAVWNTLDVPMIRAAAAEIRRLRGEPLARTCDVCGVALTSADTIPCEVESGRCGINR